MGDYHERRNQGLTKFRTKILNSESRSVHILWNEIFGKTEKWWKEYCSIFDLIHTAWIGSNDPRLLPIFSKVETLKLMVMNFAVSGVYPNVSNLTCNVHNVADFAPSFPCITKLVLDGYKVIDLKTVVELFPQLEHFECRVAKVGTFEDIADLKLVYLTVNRLQMRVPFDPPIKEEEKVVRLVSIIKKFSYSCLQINIVLERMEDLGVFSSIMFCMIWIPQTRFLLSHDSYGELFYAMYEAGCFVGILGASDLIEVCETTRDCWIGKLFPKEIERNRIRGKRLISYFKEEVEENFE
jgi:hypothetical protein